MTSRLREAAQELHTFQVRVVREAGSDGAGGPVLPAAEELLIIEATSLQEAYTQSHLMSKIRFIGQRRRTFINDTEYFDERY